VRFVYHAYPSGTWDSLAMSSTGNPNEYAATAGALAVGQWEYLVRAVDAQFAEVSTDPFVFAVAEACENEVSYDDGGAEASHWSDVTYYRWAVRFDPVVQPFLLCNALVGISGVKPDSAHSPVHVEVLLADGPGNTPGSSVLARTVGSVGNVVGGVPADPENWLFVVLRDSVGEPLEIEGSFYIAVSNSEGIAFEAFLHDTSSVRAGHSLVYDPCDEAWYNELDAQPSCRPGNRMIRAGGYALVPPEHLTAAPSGNDIVLRWLDTGAPLYRVYFSTTFENPTYSYLGETSGTSFTDVGGVSTDVKFYEVRAATP